MPLSTYIASMRMTILNHVFVTQTVNAQLVILDYLVFLFIRQLLESIAL